MTRIRNHAKRISILHIAKEENAHLPVNSRPQTHISAAQAQQVTHQSKAVVGRRY
jgi:hypothetical protein